MPASATIIRIVPIKAAGVRRWLVMAILSNGKRFVIPWTPASYIASGGPGKCTALYEQLFNLSNKASHGNTYRAGWVSFDILWKSEYNLLGCKIRSC